MTEDFIFDGVPELHPLGLSHGAFRYSTTQLFSFIRAIKWKTKLDLSYAAQPSPQIKRRISSVNISE